MALDLILAFSILEHMFCLCYILFTGFIRKEGRT